jgi:hypothetical protein
MLTQALLPLPRTHALGVAFVIVLAAGLYCLAYNALQGTSETLSNAFGWPIINLLPFFAAYEWGKTAHGSLRRAGVLALGIATSLMLGLLAAPDAGIGFEIARRLPTLALVAGLWALGDVIASRRPAAASDIAALPLLPAEIDWIEASGNYVAIHGRQRTILHRAPIGLLERALGPHGFVRAHRSVLVRRAAIARVRAVDVVLNDGTSLKTGARYRPALDILAA